MAKNSGAGCGAVASVGCALFVLFFIGVAVIGAMSGSVMEHAAKSSGYAAKETVNWCNRASAMEEESAKELGSNLYQSAYDDAVKGLGDNGKCDDDDASLVNKAYLLSMRGLAEHHLARGDAITDLNQANMLLEECATRPSLYGTHIGAQCNTQQENNISAKTNWETDE